MASRLTVVADAPSPSGRRTVAWATVALFAAAILSTALGADRARRPDRAAADAEALAGLALSEGSRAPATRAALRAFRDALVERPLDSRRRAWYGALLLDLGRGPADADAAAHHARRAAELAPVTVPTLRLSARTLVRAGERDEALSLVRRMFAFDAPAAARLLRELEPWLYADEWRDALPDAPTAWLAWYRVLRRTDRPEASLVVLAELRRRWPDDAGGRIAEARLAWRDGRLDALSRAFSADETLPEAPEFAPLHALRGIALAGADDAAAARRDLERARRLAGESFDVALLVGEGYAALGDRDAALSAWRSARYLARADPVRRSAALRRMARLEEATGRPGDALRHWRELLELQPGDDEARAALARLVPGRG